MWYFASGVALHDRWPIYWLSLSREAPRCHGANSSRCRARTKARRFPGQRKICFWQILMLSLRKCKKKLKRGCSPVIRWSCETPQLRRIPWEEMPAGVLSYLCQFQHKAAAAACTEGRTSHQIFRTSHERKLSSHGCKAATSLQKKVSLVQNSLKSKTGQRRTFKTYR